MNTKRNLFVATAAFVLLAASPFNSHADNGGTMKIETTAPLTEGQLLVKYAGSNQEGVLFHVQFENPGAQKCRLIIRNEENEVLYQGEFSDIHFSKTIQFLHDGSDVHPTFIIRSGKQEIRNTFSINRTLVENVVITKL